MILSRRLGAVLTLAALISAVGAVLPLLRPPDGVPATAHLRTDGGTGASLDGGHVFGPMLHAAHASACSEDGA